MANHQWLFPRFVRNLKHGRFARNTKKSAWEKVKVNYCIQLKTSSSSSHEPQEIRMELISAYVIRFSTTISHDTIQLAEQCPSYLLMRTTDSPALCQKRIWNQIDVGLSYMKVIYETMMYDNLQYWWKIKYDIKNDKK